jgi:hypothetical protein
VAHGPLVAEQIEAAERFLGALEERIHITAAFWLKVSEDGAWYLHVASDDVSDSNIDVAYGTVLQLTTASNRDPNLDPFRIKLVPGSHPLAQAAIEIQSRYPARLPTRVHGPPFGGFPIEEAYIYPMPVKARA